MTSSHREGFIGRAGCRGKSRVVHEHIHAACLSTICLKGLLPNRVRDVKPEQVGPALFPRPARRFRAGPGWNCNLRQVTLGPGRLKQWPARSAACPLPHDYTSSAHIPLRKEIRQGWVAIANHNNFVPHVNCVSFPCFRGCCPKKYSGSAHAAGRESPPRDGRG